MAACKGARVHVTRLSHYLYRFRPVGGRRPCPPGHATGTTGAAGFVTQGTEAGRAGPAHIALGTGVFPAGAFTGRSVRRRAKISAMATTGSRSLPDTASYPVARL